MFDFNILSKYKLLLVLFLSSFNAQAQYCTPAYNNGVTDTYISRVRFNTIDKTSGASGVGYQNFSNIITTVSPGTSYDLKVTYYAISANGEEMLAWFDWNSDGDFQDAGEAFDFGTVIGDNVTATLSIPIPATASSGLTRFRIIIQEDAGDPPPCPDGTYGEAEDYGLNICDGTTMQFSSSNATQTQTVPVARGNSNQQIIGINVKASGCDAPIVIKSIAFKEGDSDDIASDASLASLYYTGKSNSFSTATAVGSLAIPNTTFTIGNIDGTLDNLNEGDNWFWLAYDIPGNATLDNFVDAEVESITLRIGNNDTLVIPTNANPTGKRQVINSYCNATHDVDYANDVIESVVLGNINRTSGRPANGYSDFSLSDIDTLSSGTSKTLTITGRVTTLNVDEPGASMWLYAYVDWNRDGRFDDVNEKFFVAEIPGNTNPLGDIPFNESIELNVPGDATSGFTKMRVRLFEPYTTDLEACATGSGRGEAEDYGIKICGGADVNVSEWFCKGDDINLLATNYGSSSVEWQMSDSVSGTWNIIATADNFTETVNTTSFFRASVQEIGCPIAYSKVISLSIPEIQSLVVNPAAICDGDTTNVLINHNYGSVYMETVEGAILSDGNSVIESPGANLISEIDMSGANIVPNQNDYYSIDSVCLNVTHPNVEDLRAYLVHQTSGKRVLLFDEDDLSGADLVNTCFGPMAADIISSQTAYTGLFLPVGDLNAFSGVDNSSIWELHIQDMDGGTTGGTGTFDSWSMKFGRVSVSWSPTDSIATANADSTSIQVNPASDTTFVVSLKGAPCSVTDTANVIVIPQVNPVVSIDNAIPSFTICTGDSITFFGVTDVHPAVVPVYEWYVNGNQAGSDSLSFGMRNFNNGDTVVFKTIVNSSCGVFQNADTAYVNVVSSFTPDITLGSDASFDTLACSGDLITFSADTINPGGSATFEWFVNDALVANTDTFYVDAGTLTHLDEVKVIMSVGETCALKANVADSLIMDIQPSFDPSIVLVVNDDKPIYCLNELIEFTATITDGGPSGVLEWYHNNVLTSEANTVWSTDTFGVGTHTIEAVYITNTTCSPTPTVQTSFTFDVSNSFPPTVTIEADTNRACQGTPINLSVKDIVNGGDEPRYQWRLNGTNIAGATQATYSSNQFIDGVILSLEITSNSLCADPKEAVSNDIQIEILQNITPQVSIVADATSICENQQVQFDVHQTLGGGTNPTYQWQLNGVDLTGETGLTYTSSNLNNNDQVTIALTSDAICVTKEVDVSNPVNITVNDSILSSFELSSSNDPLCANESSLFTVTEKINLGVNPVYEWAVNGNVIPGETSDKAQIGNLKGGDIVSAQVEVKGLKCLIKPIFGEDYQVNQHSVLDSDFTVDSVDVLTYAFKSPEPDAINWSWNFGNGFSSNVQNPQHKFNKGGDYTVCLTLTDQYACEYTSCKKVEVVEPIVSIQGVDAFDFVIYPNPATDRLFIDSDKYLVHKVTLRNLIGEEVLHFSNTTESNKVIIDIQDFSAGIYILNLSYNGGVLSKRITIYDK